MIERRTLRNFGLALGIMFIIFGTRLWFKYHNYNFTYLAGLGIVFIIAGLAFPAVLKPIYAIFHKIGSFIFGWLITNAVLILFFYIVVAPIGLFMRLIGKDLLDLKIDKDKTSYWITRERKGMDPKLYEKQF